MVTAYASVSTRETSDEIDPESMRVACVAVLVNDTVYFFEEDELERLFDLLSDVDIVVGVNDFFVRVLDSYGDADFDFVGLQSVVSDALGERVTLDNVAKNTLGRERSDAVRLPLEWQSGRKNAVKRALQKDVVLLRDLHGEIRDEGRVWVKHPETFEETEVSV